MTLSIKNGDMVVIKTADTTENYILKIEDGARSLSDAKLVNIKQGHQDATISIYYNVATFDEPPTE